MPTNFRLVDRDTAYLLPPSVDEWLPDNHLARFVVEIVDELDISSLEGSYTASGSDAYHPRMMLALLFYSYATGMFSSRKMEAATYESVPVRYVAANQHKHQFGPSDDCLIAFRSRRNKGTLFQAFVVQNKPTQLPVQQLKQCAAAVQKHKDLSAGRISAQLCADQSRQPVETLTHIAGPAVQMVAVGRA